MLARWLRAVRRHCAWPCSKRERCAKVAGALQVYMLSYAESVEVAKFQQAASREKQSFVSLIQKKAHLVLPMDEV